MEYLFYLVSSLEEYNDAYGFHAQYFSEESGFFTAFLIALLTAIIVIGIFYFFICNVFNSLSKFYVWLIALLLTGGITLYLTSSIVVGGENENGEYSGFYQSIDQFASEKREEFALNTEEKDKINEEQQNLIDNLKGEGDEYEVVEMLYLSTCLWSLFFFIITSILVKGTTKYGIAIPCTWPRKLHI